MKLYRAEVWRCYPAKERCYCSDWLDTIQDARECRNDALEELKQIEPLSRFQGLVRHTECGTTEALS